LLIERANLWEAKDDHRRAIEALYKQALERHQPSRFEVSLQVEGSPLMPSLLEHLDDDPFPVQYRLWKGKWQAFADEFGYWQGVLFGFSLGIILLKGVERGEEWSSLTERLYADVGFRREVATLLVPTEQVMLCDLLAMGVSEMDADLKLTVNTRWNLT
jgi:hypothetical protein